MLSLFDAHCHVAEVGELPRLPLAAPRSLCVMSLNQFDCERVHRLAASDAVVPAFGIHPWYCHMFSFGPVDKVLHYQAVLVPAPSQDLVDLLPDPIDIGAHLARLEEYFAAHPYLLVGEIGLDRVARVPNAGWFGHKGPPGLSKCRVLFEHQKQVLRVQLEMAQRLQRPVSLHCVKANGGLLEMVKQVRLPCICLHSFTGGSEGARVWVGKGAPATRVFFSFSQWINGERGVDEVVSVVPPESWLTETDMVLDAASGYELALTEITTQVLSHTHHSVLQANQNTFLGLCRRL